MATSQADVVNILDIYDTEGARIGRLVHVDMHGMLVARDDGTFTTVGYSGARWKPLPKKNKDDDGAQK